MFYNINMDNINIIKHNKMYGKISKYPVEKIYKYLLTGMTYREIANRYYYRDLNKFLSELKKIMHCFNVQNRRQLLYVMFVNSHE